mmetsp:Transcript_33496/g.79466  ORF Transcript_33496/g.79466 Transcript_33496/m.79466 type:complete len:446 (-) Transcript_33496:318-1655(-)
MEELEARQRALDDPDHVAGVECLHRIQQIPQVGVPVVLCDQVAPRIDRCISKETDNAVVVAGHQLLHQLVVCPGKLPCPAPEAAPARAALGLLHCGARAPNGGHIFLFDEPRLLWEHNPSTAGWQHWAHNDWLQVHLHRQRFVERGEAHRAGLGTHRHVLGRVLQIQVLRADVQLVPETDAQHHDADCRSCNQRNRRNHDGRVKDPSRYPAATACTVLAGGCVVPVPHVGVRIVAPLPDLPLQPIACARVRPDERAALPRRSEDDEARARRKARQDDLRLPFLVLHEHGRLPDVALLVGELYVPKHRVVAERLQPPKQPARGDVRRILQRELDHDTRSRHRGGVIGRRMVVHFLKLGDVLGARVVDLALQVQLRVPLPGGRHKVALRPEEALPRRVERGDGHVHRAKVQPEGLDPLGDGDPLRDAVDDEDLSSVPRGLCEHLVPD